MHGYADELKEVATRAGTVSSRRVLERAPPSEGQEGSRRENSNRRVLSNHQEVLVTADEDLCVGRNGIGQDTLVVGVSQRERGWHVARWDDFAPLKDRFCRGKCGLACLQLFSKNPADLPGNNLRDNKFILGHHKLKEVGTKAPGDESGDQDVGIQTDSRHETSLKTSSSV